jgi:hypothetical protein
MPVVVLFSKNIAARNTAGPDPALGDQFFFTDFLLEEPGDKVVGLHSGFCTLLRINQRNAPDLYQCQATLTLPQGQITARGAFNIPAAPAVGELSGRAAITGGTDAYATARGQISVTTLTPQAAEPPATGERYRFEIDIR